MPLALVLVFLSSHIIHIFVYLLCQVYMSQQSANYPDTESDPPLWCQHSSENILDRIITRMATYRLLLCTNHMNGILLTSARKDMNWWQNLLTYIDACETCNIVYVCASALLWCMMWWQKQRWQFVLFLCKWTIHMTYWPWHIDIWRIFIIHTLFSLTHLTWSAPCYFHS